MMRLALAILLALAGCAVAAESDGDRVTRKVGILAYRGDEANSLFGWVSIDQGESWQESNVSALAAGRTGSVYGSVFKVEGRGYSVAGHFREGSCPDTQGIWMSTSDDGLHWKAPEKVTDRPLVEPAFVAMEENIIGLARPNTDRYEQIVANRRNRTHSLY